MLNRVASEKGQRLLLGVDQVFAIGHDRCNHRIALGMQHYRDCGLRTPQWQMHLVGPAATGHFVNHDWMTFRETNEFVAQQR